MSNHLDLPRDTMTQIRVCRIWDHFFFHKKKQCNILATRSQGLGLDPGPCLLSLILPSQVLDFLQDWSQLRTFLTLKPLLRRLHCDHTEDSQVVISSPGRSLELQEDSRLLDISTACLQGTSSWPSSRFSSVGKWRHPSPSSVTRELGPVLTTSHPNCVAGLLLLSIFSPITAATASLNTRLNKTRTFSCLHGVCSLYITK